MTVRPSIWIALVAVYILWGSTYLAIRLSVETIPPFAMSGLRFVIAGGTLLAWRLYVAARAGTLPTAMQWRRALVIGALLLLGGNGAVAWAEQTVPSGITALIVSSVPLWMALIDRVFFGRRLSIAAIVGLVVGFGGVALLVDGPSWGGSVSLLGAAILVAGSLSWASGSIYARQAHMPEDSLLSTGMEMLLGGLCLCIAALATGEFSHLDIAAVTTQSWIAFAYLIFFGGIAGFSAYLWVIRNGPTTLVSTYAFVNPMVAVFLGWTLGHELVGPRVVAAGVTIIAAVALIVSSREKPPVESGECG